MRTNSDNSLHSVPLFEQMLRNNPSTDRILLHALEQLMQLMRAAYGYAFQCHEPEGERIPWTLIGSYASGSAHLHEIACTTSLREIPADWHTRILAGHSLWIEESDLDQLPAPDQHPPITNCLCIPILDSQQVHGILYLCNTPRGFAHFDPERTGIHAFLSSIRCLLRSIRQHERIQPARHLETTVPDYLGLLAELLDSMFNAVVLFDEQEQITQCNKAAATLLEIPRRELLGQPLRRFLERSGLRIEGYSSQEIIGGPGIRSVWRGVPISTARDQKILVDISGFHLEYGSQTLHGLVMEDISEHLQSTADHQAILQRLQVLTHLAPIGILQLDRNWQCTYVNDTWCDYAQMSPSEIEGSGWIDGLYRGDQEATLQKLRQETLATGRYEGQFRLQSPLGRTIWVQASACQLYTNDGDTTGLIMTVTDISEHLRREHHLREIAEKDQLTGLINRIFFTERVEKALSHSQPEAPIALMFLDLDEFKNINDTLGHDAGDQLLCGVAHRLQRVLKQADAIARIGGDEFTVLLTRTCQSQLAGIAEQLIRTLEEPFMIRQRPIYVTYSIGIAVAEAAPTTVKQLLKQADAALYKAKAGGRNQYRFYSPEMDQNSHLLIHLRRSLKEFGRCDFRVVYQPQVDARTGQLLGLEALTRWTHPEQDEYISPSIFMRMIEDSGLIMEFSDWLLEDVLSQASYWLNTPKGQHLNIAINLSARQFRNPELASSIHDRCRTHGTDPWRIVLEVTETALIDDIESATQTLRKLHAMGFGIALDDFGTGYSSLHYLRTMPVKHLKIDQSFVRDVIHDEDDAKIVSAILGLARTLELGIVAEGVENAAVRDWLLRNDCHIQQGFFFHRPLEREQVEALLEIPPPPAMDIPLENKLQ